MKPAGLCQSYTDPVTQLEWEADYFANDLKWRGLRCHPATTRTDAYQLFTFFADLWAPADVETMPQLDRIVRHGAALMIEEADSGRVVAAQIAEVYADGTVQALRYGVDPLYRKTGLGAELVRAHAHWAASCRRGTVRRGAVDLASPDALASLTVLVNHLGCVADGCDTYLWGPGSTVLTLTLPLTPLGLVATRIDQVAAKDWVLTTAPHDYRLLEVSNPERIAAIYRETPYRIVAVFAGGALLAVPLACGDPMTQRRTP